MGVLVEGNTPIMKNFCAVFNTASGRVQIMEVLDYENGTVHFVGYDWKKYLALVDEIIIVPLIS